MPNYGTNYNRYRKNYYKKRPTMVAEISANHGGSTNTLLETITAAKDCGADAIKIQTYSPDDMTLNCDDEDFIVKKGIWKGMKLYDLYTQGQTYFSWHEIIFNHCAKIGIECFSSPFSLEAVALLETLGCTRYKIASFEIKYKQLIQAVAKTGKPIIISTGMATINDVGDAIRWIHDVSPRIGHDITLLHCISQYPTLPSDGNLNNIKHLQSIFTSDIGLSDHTMTNTNAIIATYMGATMIEKHFILDRNNSDSPDASFSMEPSQFYALCVDCKDAYFASNDLRLPGNPHDSSIDVQIMRSLYIVKDTKKGEIFTSENVKVIRPGYGLPPVHLGDTLGKIAKDNYKKGTKITLDMIV